MKCRSFNFFVLFIIHRSFVERITETEDAKKQAEENLERTNLEIENLDYNIKIIKQAIRAKSNPLKVKSIKSAFEINVLMYNHSL